MRRSLPFLLGTAFLVLVSATASTTVVAAVEGPSAAPSPRSDDGTVVAFEPAATVTSSEQPPIVADKLAHAERSRFVETLAPSVSSFGATSSVRLELFPDAVVDLHSDGPPVPGAAGSTTWSGLAPNGDYATLTFIDGLTIGTASVAGEVYDISSVADGTHLIVEEGRAFPDESPPLPAPGNEAMAEADAPSTASDPVIDVLTWYETGSRTYYGGDAAAQSELAATINEVNAAYARSGVDQSLRSVGIEYVAYTGTGDASIELNLVTSDWDGQLDAIHDRREAVGADLVSLIEPIPGSCGLAWLGGPLDGSTGFSLVAPNCARGNLTFAHELGHNMGAGHGAPDGGGLFSYSNGYRDAVNGFRTILAYNAANCPGGFCQRIGYFSTPNVLYNNLPLGSATQDNTRTLNDTAASISAYRSATAGISGTVSESGSAAFVPGAWVAVLRAADFTIAGAGVADGSGNFSTQVPAGSYFLYVIDPAGARLPGFFGAPTLVAVTAGDVVDADPQMAPLRGSISATVTDSGTGQPVAGVWGLALSATGGNTGATEVAATANGAGQLSLPGLRAGNHFVGYVDPTGAHAPRFYPNSLNVPDSTVVAVTAGNATAANAALPPQTPVGTGSIISGTITEQGTGTPLAGARVVALRVSDYAMVRGAVTNASGVYSLDLAAGEYKLAILDGTGLHDMEWYDNQPSTALGSAATVIAPGVANAALSPNRGRMTGTITDESSGTPIGGVWVAAIGPNGIAGGAVTAPDGTYTISGLAPGTYRATFVDPNGGRAQEYHQNSVDYAGATPINVTAATTTTINAALDYP